MGLPTKIDADHVCQMYEGVDYKQFWNVSQKNNLDNLEHSIVRALLPTHGRRIVDVGCGFGRLADCYLDRFEQVVMLDGSMSLLQQAQEIVGEKAVYIAADANHLPFRPSSFDCLLLMRVFHHLSDSQAVLEEVQRVLCYKGAFVFNFCNKVSPRQILSWLLNRTHESPLTLDTIGIGTRFISHHPKYVHQLLQKNGYFDMKYLGAGVFDKIPDPFGILLPLAKLFAPFFALTNLSPWINCRAISPSVEMFDLDLDLEDIFICPVCGSSLLHLPKAYVCKECEHIYPIENGIIDFRSDPNGLF